ncbi:MAG: Holliday junction resolvase RuvX [Anaerolineae bacterium]
MNLIPGKLLGVDYGTKVIGLATCDALGLIASPYGLIQRKSRKEDFARIARIVEELGIAEIICGVPLPPPHYTGRSLADTVRRWARRLAASVPVPVRLWDETLSSEEAEMLLEESGGRSRERIDDAAAAVMLQSYLDALREGFQPPTPVTPTPDNERL